MRPVSVLGLRDWPQGDKSRGVWGAEPAQLRRAAVCIGVRWCSMIVYVLRSSATAVWNMVLGLRACSQSFFSSGIPTLRFGREILGPGCIPDTSLREFDGR